MTPEINDLAARLDDHAVRFAGDYGYNVASDLKRAAELLRSHAHISELSAQAILERDAADEVSRTAQLYVGAMEEKLAKAVGLLDDLLGLERGSADAAFAFVDRYRADIKKGRRAVVSSPSNGESK